jgi:DNA polymerase-4
LADGVAGRLRGQGKVARTVTLKVRFADFQTITRATTLAAPTATAHGIVAAALPLLLAIDPATGVRLLGVSASQLAGAADEQLTLDDSTAAGGRDWRVAENTIDAIRSRFGNTAIGAASAVEGSGLRLVRRGAQQWGPDQGPAVP